ncbi:hypothetical protein IHQ56_15985, partial [Methylobacillus flagellatus]|uniref:hypothetical protein n=1 Tax=Methylobacillus flagellatus TaxID=405 RepID=UPI002853951D
GDGWVTTSPYPEHVAKILFRMGDASQTAYPDLVSTFSGYWTADHRGDGIAHAYLYAGGVDAEEFSEIYPNRIPSLQAFVRGVELYDPRTSTTGYDNNYALIMRDYLTHADGLQVDPAYIDDADFIQAANDCGGLVPIKGGGTMSRYHGALSYSFEEEPQAVIGRILTNCDGDLRLKPNGKIGFSVGVWHEPTVTITDDNIIDYTMSDGGGPLRESNEYRLKYTEPHEDWPEVEAEPWRIDSEIAEYGEVRSTTIEAYGVQHHNHARRLMKIAAYRGSPRWQGTIKTTLAGLRAWDERWIRVQLADLEIDETFEVGAVEFDFDTFSVTISIASFAADAYDFDPETEEGTAPTLPEEIPSFPISPPADFAATGGVVDIGGGVNQPTIFVSWAGGAPRPGVNLQLQYAVAGTDEWQAGPTVPSAATSAQITGLADGGIYDVRARWAGAVTSDWVMIEDVTVTAYIDAPDPPTLMGVSSPGAGEASVQWRNPNDTSFYAAHVFRGTTATFVAAVDVSGPIFGAANSIDTFDDDGLDPDTYFYWVVASNGSGIQSTPAGPDSVVVS